MQSPFVSKVIGRLNVYGRPSHVKVVVRDSYGVQESPHSDEAHLQAAMAWLCRAQDVTGCGGVSAKYDLRAGWQPPYPETTGYIIPTFLQYAAQKTDSAYVERAIRMGDWEIEIQLPSGAMRGGIGVNSYPMVFDTGQVILGWTSLCRATKLTRFLDAATQAADWLVSIQDPDGKWTKYTLMGIPHAYYAKVAWSLLEVYRLTTEEKYRQSAEKNILWALTQAQENGWLKHTGFTSDGAPVTHTIAYAWQGLIESSVYLEQVSRQKIFDLIKAASASMLAKYAARKNGFSSSLIFLPGTLNEQWESTDPSSCLTGNVQMALVWLKLYRLTGYDSTLGAAVQFIDQVKATQSLDSPNPGIRGGIAGSYPIWGRYLPYAYLNWSAKFFADAILLKQELGEV